MENQFEVYFEHRYENNSIQIWMIENNHNGRWNVQSDGDSFTLQPYEPGIILKEPLKPLLQLPKPYADALFREISQEYLKKGIKTKDESRLEGTLEATENHLADMQIIASKLLKINLKIKK